MKRVIKSLICALALTGCQTLAEADKGLYSVADSVAKPDIVTGGRTANITDRKSQIETGNKAAETALKQYGGNVNEKLDKAAYDRLSAIFKRIHAVAHYRDEPWSVYLIPDDSFNAYVTGGTIVIVHKGLMDALENDDEIAAVLGHEIAHVTANHIFETSAYKMGARIVGDKRVKRESFAYSYSVGHEKEADQIGILYAALAGYDPAAASRVWGRMFKQHGNYGAMLSSHPMNSHRAKETAEIAKIVQQYYMPNQINPDFSAILENNMLWKKNPPAKALPAGEGGGLVAVAEATANTFARIQEAKLEKLNQEQRIELIRTLPQVFKFRELEALSPNSFGFRFLYQGRYPIKNVVLKSRYGEQELLFHADDIIYPNREFIAVFETPEPVQRNKISKTYYVDNAEFAD